MPLIERCKKKIGIFRLRHKDFNDIFNYIYTTYSLFQDTLDILIL